MSNPSQVISGIHQVTENSFQVVGPRLFYSMPAKIRNMKNCLIDEFKSSLDKYLVSIPDGYRFCRPKGRNPAQEMAAFRRNPVILLSKIMEKAAVNCCLFVKTCTFSYTHRLDKIYQRMLSIFVRNITFLVHIYTRKICL